MQFQIKTLAQHGPMSFQDYKQFIELGDKSSIEDKSKLAKLYLHSLTLSNMNFWDPNAKLGDLQMMALTSWMTHEKARAKEVRKVLEKEEKEPLYIMEKQIISMIVINTHSIIFNDANLAPKYLSSEAQEISHF